MSNATLLLDAALAAAISLLYTYVGGITLRRDTSDAPGRRAVRLFAVWWFGLAVLTVLGAIRNVLAVLGYTDVGMHEALSSLAAVPLVAILWGLVSYLAYIYTGSTRVFGVVTAIHAALLVFVLYVVATLEATAVDVRTWNVGLDYDVELGATTTLVLIFGILAPAIISALAYATLYFRTDDRSARYRIAMVSGAFLLWFGSSAVASALQLGQNDWWPLASRSIALVATLMVIAAYRPPGWARERFALRSVEERPPGYGEKRMRLARSGMLARLLPSA